MTVLIDGRRAVDPGAVRDAGILPQQFSIGGGDSGQRLRGEVHVLALSLEIDRDGGAVGRSRIARYGALPDRLTGEFVECDDRRSFATGCADDFVAIDQRRFAVTPGEGRCAEIA